MPLRLLHRPLLRSVAAAWQPATTAFASFYSGDGGRTGAGQRQEDEPATSQTVTRPREERKTSLFEELFPDEARLADAKRKRESEPDVPKSLWVSQLFEEPLRQAAEEVSPDKDKDKADDEAAALAAKVSELYPAARGSKSMLVLSAASKCLLESDFFRLGMKGKHVDGWVGGIQKVIQARDPDTLEPKGHYFILFDTHEAAMLYQEGLERLWKLSKQYVPRAHHRHHSFLQEPLPLGIRHTDYGEDIGRLVRSFTLVVPTQRRQLQVSTVSPNHIEEMYVQGGFVDQLASVAGSSFLVLIRLDGGFITINMLRRAIEDDGVERNLPWRITDLRDGILPFGKSILKTSDKTQPQPPHGTLLHSVKELENNAYEGENGSDSGDDRGGTRYEMDHDSSKDGDKHLRRYSRFIVPFEDKAEAHRFVRNWHRRELNFQMGGREDEDPFWEEIRIVNAEVLW
ncbi:hypothetical protein GGS20DRAFT_417447 [Poronia punctata]|nr:hypothetical protein GGS20DRAFT_417447 [Poronia punctata]